MATPIPLDPNKLLGFDQIHADDGNAVSPPSDEKGAGRRSPIGDTATDPAAWVDAARNARLGGKIGAKL